MGEKSGIRVRHSGGHQKSGGADPACTERRGRERRGVRGVSSRRIWRSWIRIPIPAWVPVGYVAGAQRHCQD